MASPDTGSPSCLLLVQLPDVALMMIMSYLQGIYLGPNAQSKTSTGRLWSKPKLVVINKHHEEFYRPVGPRTGVYYTDQYFQSINNQLLWSSLCALRLTCKKLATLSEETVPIFALIKQFRLGYINKLSKPSTLDSTIALSSSWSIPKVHKEAIPWDSEVEQQLILKHNGVSGYLKPYLLAGDLPDPNIEDTSDDPLYPRQYPRSQWVGYLATHVHRAFSPLRAPPPDQAPLLNLHLLVSTRLHRLELEKIAANAIESKLLANSIFDYFVVGEYVILNEDIEFHIRFRLLVHLPDDPPDSPPRYLHFKATAAHSSSCLRAVKPDANDPFNLCHFFVSKLQPGVRGTMFVSLFQVAVQTDDPLVAAYFNIPYSPTCSTIVIMNEYGACGILEPITRPTVNNPDPLIYNNLPFLEKLAALYEFPENSIDKITHWFAITVGLEGMAMATPKTTYPQSLVDRMYSYPFLSLDMEDYCFNNNHGVDPSQVTKTLNFGRPFSALLDRNQFELPVPLYRLLIPETYMGNAKRIIDQEDDNSNNTRANRNIVATFSTLRTAENFVYSSTNTTLAESVWSPMSLESSSFELLEFYLRSVEQLLVRHRRNTILLSCIQKRMKLEFEQRLHDPYARLLSQVRIIDQVESEFPCGVSPSNPFMAPPTSRPTQQFPVSFTCLFDIQTEDPDIKLRFAHRRYPTTMYMSIVAPTALKAWQWATKHRLLLAHFHFGCSPFNVPMPDMTLVANRYPELTSVTLFPNQSDAPMPSWTWDPIVTFGVVSSISVWNLSDLVSRDGVAIFRIDNNDSSKFSAGSNGSSTSAATMIPTLDVPLFEALANVLGFPELSAQDMFAFLIRVISQGCGTFAYESELSSTDQSNLHLTNTQQWANNTNINNNNNNISHTGGQLHVKSHSDTFGVPRLSSLTSKSSPSLMSSKDENSPDNPSDILEMPTIQTHFSRSEEPSPEKFANIDRSSEITRTNENTLLLTSPTTKIDIEKQNKSSISSRSNCSGNENLLVVDAPAKSHTNSLHENPFQFPRKGQLTITPVTFERQTVGGAKSSSSQFIPPKFSQWCSGRVPWTPTVEHSSNVSHSTLSGSSTHYPCICTQEGFTQLTPDMIRWADYCTYDPFDYRFSSANLSHITENSLSHTEKQPFGSSQKMVDNSNLYVDPGLVGELPTMAHSIVCDGNSPYMILMSGPTKRFLLQLVESRHVLDDAHEVFKRNMLLPQYSYESSTLRANGWQIPKLNFYTNEQIDMLRPPEYRIVWRRSTVEWSTGVAFTDLTKAISHFKSKFKDVSGVDWYPEIHLHSWKPTTNNKESKYIITDPKPILIPESLGSPNNVNTNNINGNTNNNNNNNVTTNIGSNGDNLRTSNILTYSDPNVDRVSYIHEPLLVPDNLILRSLVSTPSILCYWSYWYRTVQFDIKTAHMLVKMALMNSLPGSEDVIMALLEYAEICKTTGDVVNMVRTIHQAMREDTSHPLPHLAKADSLLWASYQAGDTNTELMCIDYALQSYKTFIHNSTKISSPPTATIDSQMLNSNAPESVDGGIVASPSGGNFSSSSSAAHMSPNNSSQQLQVAPTSSIPVSPSPSSSSFNTDQATSSTTPSSNSNSGGGNIVNTSLSYQPSSESASKDSLSSNLGIPYSQSTSVPALTASFDPLSVYPLLSNQNSSPTLIQIRRARFESGKLLQRLGRYEEAKVYVDELLKRYFRRERLELTLDRCAIILAIGLKAKEAIESIDHALKKEEQLPSYGGSPGSYPLYTKASMNLRSKAYILLATAHVRVESFGPASTALNNFAKLGGSDPRARYLQTYIENNKIRSRRRQYGHGLQIAHIQQQQAQQQQQQQIQQQQQQQQRANNQIQNQNQNNNQQNDSQINITIRVDTGTPTSGNNSSTAATSSTATSSAVSSVLAVESNEQPVSSDSGLSNDGPSYNPELSGEPSNNNQTNEPVSPIKSNSSTNLAIPSTPQHTDTPQQSQTPTSVQTPPPSASPSHTSSTNTGGGGSNSNTPQPSTSSSGSKSRNSTPTSSMQQLTKHLDYVPLKRAFVSRGLMDWEYLAPLFKKVFNLSRMKRVILPQTLFAQHATIPRMCDYSHLIPAAFSVLLSMRSVLKNNENFDASRVNLRIQSLESQYFNLMPYMRRYHVSYFINDELNRLLYLSDATFTCNLLHLALQNSPSNGTLNVTHYVQNILQSQEDIEVPTKLHPELKIPIPPGSSFYLPEEFIYDFPYIELLNILKDYVAFSPIDNNSPKGAIIIRAAGDFSTTIMQIIAVKKLDPNVTKSNSCSNSSISVLFDPIDAIEKDILTSNILSGSIVDNQHKSHLKDTEYSSPSPSPSNILSSSSSSTITLPSNTSSANSSPMSQFERQDMNSDSSSLSDVLVTPKDDELLTSSVVESFFSKPNLKQFVRSGPPMLLWLHVPYFSLPRLLIKGVSLRFDSVYPCLTFSTALKTAPGQIALLVEVHLGRIHYCSPDEDCPPPGYDSLALVNKFAKFQEDDGTILLLPQNIDSSATMYKVFNQEQIGAIRYVVYARNNHASSSKSNKSYRGKD